ncbi:hypothetical protein HDZ31DRAFT_79399 [Schizophyllum fasciatum]
MILADGVTERLAVDINCAGAAALAILIWCVRHRVAYRRDNDATCCRETLICLDQEVKHIWSRPNTAWLKWTYLFIRYFALAALTCDRAFNLAALYSRTLPENALRVWFICQPVVAHLCMLGVEGIMMARVYALYQKRTWVAVMAIAVLATNSIILLIGVLVTLPDELSRADFVRFCSKALSFFGISSFLTQILILALMLAQYRRGRWRQVPLMSLVVRDGVLVFAVFAVYCAVMTIYPLLNLDFTAAAFPWLMTSISVAGTRLVLNMQALPADPSTDATTALQLTTYFSVPFYSDAEPAEDDPPETPAGPPPTQYELQP